MKRGKKMSLFKIVRVSFFLMTIIFSNSIRSINPCISIITSLYKGDLFIKGFLDDITQQTIFNDCELIIINANSPGNEEQIISSYMQAYPNIVYRRLDYDPGIYAVWNEGIQMARGDFITNANVDDRLANNCYEVHLKQLLDHPKIDLVYSDCYVTKHPNQTFANHTRHSILARPQFSKDALKKVCLPNNHPMWRKSLHEKYGYFDTAYKIAGDWEFWLRIVYQGAQFLKIERILSLYYLNPNGLSTNDNGNWKHEFDRVYYTYKNQ